METALNFVMAALEPLRGLSLRLAGILPALAAGVLLLLIGAVAGHWLRVLVERVMKAAKVDDLFRRVGLSGILTRLGLGSSMTQLVGIVVHAVLILAFVVAAAEAAGFTIVNQFLARMLSFAPSLIAAVFVMGAGLFLGELAGGVVHRAATANRVRGADAIMRMTHGLVVIAAGLMALEVLGIDTRIFLDSMRIIIASIGLGCAIAFGVAFGLAGRDAAERWIRDLTPKGSKESVNGGHHGKMRVVR